MKKALSLVVLLTAVGCGGAEPPPVAPAAAPTPAEPSAPEVKTDMQTQAQAFLDAYYQDLATAEKAQALGYWTAANSGKKEDWDAFAAADVALKTLHSDPQRFADINGLLSHRDELEPVTARALEIAKLAFGANQLPKETIEKLVAAQSEIEQVYTSFRPMVDGKPASNNDLLDVLKTKKRQSMRRAAWSALKEVGAQVGPKIVALAKLRNEAAKSLGYENFWDMQVRLQEHDPARLLAIFDELDKLTAEPFQQMKAQLDKELSKKFNVPVEQIMPWHYDNPFFQAAPPSAAVDLDEFYAPKFKKEEIVAMADRFFGDIGLDIKPIAERSDFYEREGKDQHAFCITIDRGDDVRTLLNVKPTEEWMETMLHEMGHALYYVGIDKSIPYNLRESAHIFTTEAVAMLFGALAKNPTWMMAYAGADAKRVAELEQPILEQRRREQLIFARWVLVMLNFEKALYTDPAQDLNTLWWDMVERYQGLKRPAKRNAPDWASKPHFTIAPVYYHNYMLGELFAAQLRVKLAEMAGHTGPTNRLSFNNRKDFGAFLSQKVFWPGMTRPWPEFVEESTGAPLSPTAFASELK